MTNLEKRMYLNPEVSSGMFEQGIMGPKYLEYALEMDVRVPGMTIFCPPWNSDSEWRALAIEGTEHGFL